MKLSREQKLDTAASSLQVRIAALHDKAMLSVHHLLSRFDGLREKTLIYHVNQNVEISMRVAWTGPIECVGDMQKAQSMLYDNNSKSDQQYLLRVKSGR